MPFAHETLNRKMRYQIPLRWLFASIALLVLATGANAQNEIVYVQSLTQGADGTDGMTGASDTAVSADGRHVYVAAYGSSSIAIFSRNAALGTLAYVGKATHNVGGALMAAVFAVDVSPDGKHVYGGSPSSSSIVAFARDPDTGLLTLIENQLTSEQPFTAAGFISVSVSGDGKSVYGVGGSTDGLVVFSRDPDSGALTYVEEHLDNVGGNLLGQGYSPTASPINNISVSGDGRFVYVTSTDDDAVTVYARDAQTGALTVASTIIDGIGGSDGLDGASSLVMSPDNRFLYVSGQAESSLSIFSRDQTTGALTYIGKKTHGADGITTLSGARSLAVSPDGRYLYVSAIASNAVSVFGRDTTTGELTFATSATNGVDGVENLASVSGMVTDPLSRNLYAAGQTNAAVVVFRLPIPAVVLRSTTTSVDDGGAPAVLDAGLELFDADDTHLESGSVRIIDGFRSGDFLSFTAQAGITAHYDASTGVLSLSGNAPLSDYQSILRSVQFQANQSPPLSEGQTSTREIAFALSDGDNESADAVVSVTVNAVSSVVYTLSYAAGANGTVSGTASQSVSNGGSGTAVSAVPSIGHRFTQWSDGSTANPRIDINVVADVSVTANFEINSYTLSYAAGSNGSLTGAALQTVNHGGSGAAVTAVPAAHYRFVQWSDGSTVNPRTDSNVISNRSATASFAASSFVVTPGAGAHGSISPSSPQSVNQDTTIQFSVVPEPGYFASVASNCGGSLDGSLYTTEAITADCEVAVSFALVMSVTQGDGEPFADATLRSGEEQQFSVNLLPDTITGTLKRGGETIALTPAQIDALLTTDAEGRYSFRAQRTGEYSLTLLHSVSAQQHTVVIAVPARAAWGSQRQFGSAGVIGRARLVLDDAPIEYPVRLPVEVGRYALTDLNERIVVEIEAGLSAAVTFTPNANEGEVVLTLTEGAINAELGGLTIHRAQLRQLSEVPFPVSLNVDQSGRSDTVVMQDGGIVNLTVTAGAPASIDWSESDLALNIRVQTTAAVSIDPSLLDGQYRVRARITETQTPHRIANVEVLLRIASPADLNRYAAHKEFELTQSAQQLTICPGGNFRVADCSNEQLQVSVPEGYTLRLGSTAETVSWSTSQYGVGVTLNDLHLQQNAADPNHEHVGVIVDFELDDLEAAGESVPVVVELPSAESIPANAKWRKYTEETGWQDFVQDDANALHSALRTADDECPWVGADVWQAGLLVGNECVRLTLEDGGPNDADREADGVIRDPGTLAIAVSGPVEITGSRDLKSGGGSFGIWCIAVLAFFAVLRHARVAVISLLGLIAVATAQAEETRYDNLYFGAQIGWAQTDISSSQISARMNERGISGSATTIDNERSATRVLAGYRVTNILGIEAGYTQLGRINTRFADLNTETSARDLRSVRPGTGRGAELAVTSGYDFASRLRGEARLGLLHWNADHFLDNGSRDDSRGTDPLYGFALHWRLNDHWSGRMSWDRYKVESDVTELLGIGLTYRIGTR